jgi:hypothetical protein
MIALHPHIDPDFVATERIDVLIGKIGWIECARLAGFL